MDLLVEILGEEIIRDIGRELKRSRRLRVFLERGYLRETLRLERELDRAIRKDDEADELGCAPNCSRD